jgi:hypothetical protein
MAIDKVSLWRNAPTAEIALDNELFLEAQQSQFLQKDFLLTAGSPVSTLRLRITQPSIVIGSFMFDGDVQLRFADLSAGDPEGYHCTYSCYDDVNWGNQAVHILYATLLSVTSRRATMLCNISPNKTEKFIDLTLVVNAASAGTKLLRGSYLKIL